MKNWQNRMSFLWARYKYFLAVIAVGVLLLLSAKVPASEPAKEEGTQTEAAFDLKTFQQSVADSLAQIEGAGRVEVLLSLEAGEESVYASDVSQSSQSTGGSSDSTSETYQSTMSILSDGSYGETPVLIKSKYPTFRGAVILCEGADSDTVRLQIVQAVSALCGISSDHISISKLKQ
ncbi:hypothetical protein [Butyricicoccus sp.]|uniref:hypothetical protein n=1 Tax=Butyricicoccus sp. TaxID=2049021 RepID=UPI003F175476